MDFPNYQDPVRNIFRGRNFIIRHRFNEYRVFRQDQLESEATYNDYIPYITKTFDSYDQAKDYCLEIAQREKIDVFLQTDKGYLLIESFYNEKPDNNKSEIKMSKKKKSTKKTTKKSAKKTDENKKIEPLYKKENKTVFKDEVKIGSNYNTHITSKVYISKDNIHYVKLGLNSRIDGDHNFSFTMHYPSSTDIELFGELLIKTAKVIKKHKLDTD